MPSSPLKIPVNKPVNPPTAPDIAVLITFQSSLHIPPQSIPERNLPISFPILFQSTSLRNVPISVNMPFIALPTVAPALDQSIELKN